MAITHVSVLSLLLCSAYGHVITAPARLPPAPTAIAASDVEGEGQHDALPGHELFKKQDALDCDGKSVFTCNTGTCYTGHDGFIGCCSVSSCKPRTTCIDWHPSVTVRLDADTAGFLYCSDPALPLCNRLLNVQEDQYILWCDSTGSSQVTVYKNTVTTGLHATDLPSSFDSRLLFPTTTTGPTETPSAAATPSVVTVVSTQGPPIAGATSPPTEDVDGKEADPEKEHNSTPSGAIAGIAVGATAAGLLLLAALWYFRRTRKSNGSIHGEVEKPTSPTPDPSRPTTNGSQGSPYATSKTLTPIDTKNNSPISRFPGHPNKLHELGSPTSSAPELGSLQRYTVTNPDMTSPIETAPASPVEAPSSPYTIRPVRSSTSLVSPIVDTTNRDSSVSALWPSPAGPPSSTFTPYTPSNYNPSAPSSVARTTNLQPPSLPQPYSAATFASSTQTPCTPSNYRSEAPGSIPPALRPSVIPQEYSAATFESDSPLARSPGYRGLGEGRSGAPWEYLSAESAIGGGWVNESPTRREH